LGHFSAILGWLGFVSSYCVCHVRVDLALNCCPKSNVGAGSDKFSVEVHHSRLFIGHGSQRVYADEKVNVFNNLSARTWSPLWFEKLNFALHYPKNPALNVYWLLPGKEFPSGLRLILSERETQQ
jgi:hypothetical protein